MGKPQTLFGKEIALKLTFVGLSGAGKTTLLKHLQKIDPSSSIEETLPTMGMNIEILKLGIHEILAVDMGGQIQYAEGFWQPHVETSAAVVFVFDSADAEIIDEASIWLQRVINWTDKSNTALLFLANKNDKEEALDLKTIIKRLRLSNIIAKRPHSFAVYSISALYGMGVKEAFEWLTIRIERMQGNKKP
ncbi:MAG: ADP-ribosylation factor-like protein [Candidatus Hermodarchaeota archaeon]